MIQAEERFVSEGQCYMGSRENPRTKAYCNVWDWDQRRMIKIKGTAQIFPPDEDLEVPLLAGFVDYLAPQVQAVSVDNDGLITQVSTDPEEDDTEHIGYLPFSMVESLHGCRTVWYSQLKELDRLGPGVDRSSYYNESHDVQDVAFKFNPFEKSRRRNMAWNELQAYRRLPPHPNLIPLDRVVLEDKESRIIGFTIKFIPGGTFENLTRPFRVQHLKDLIQLVDFLNLNLGIMHQDIAPRNLFLDPETENILLFDFDWVAHGEKDLLKGRDDVIGVALTLYELITGDDQFTHMPHWERNAEMIQNVSEWPCKRELDADVSTFRKVLDEWIATRRIDNDMERYLNAPNRLTWPDLPTPPDYDVPYQTGTTQDGHTVWRTGWRFRRDAIRNGQHIFRWERPPQSRLPKGEGASFRSRNGDPIIQSEMALLG
ncbi:hypothetical protein F5Y18DRAFT_430270 [Xylariaceae sp. FL1019]|nr:hypothetical protein F5Y18DRAFT_430270 [Xylariaceae sp. FL1019]